MSNTNLPGASDISIDPLSHAAPPDPTPSTHIVTIAGDLVVDHHLYEGDRWKPHNTDGRGVLHVRSIGGANGVRQLLDAVAEADKAAYEAEVAAYAAAMAAYEAKVAAAKEEVAAAKEKVAAYETAVAAYEVAAAEAEVAAAETEAAAAQAEVAAAAKEEVAAAEEKVAAVEKNGPGVEKPRQAPIPLACTLGVACPDVDTLYAPHHAFALWRPHKMTRKKDEKRWVWRTNLALGYGHDPIEGATTAPHAPKPRLELETADLLVLDDAGSLFRKGIHRECWHLPAPNSKTWVLLKLSDPIAQGDLWRELASLRAERLVVVVAAEDLRRETVRIGAGLSWEQTLEDLATELGKPALKSLGEAAHLIVTFGGDAAICISREKEGEARFCFDASRAEKDFAEEHDGRVIGYMTCMAAALAYGLTQATSPNFIAAMESGLRGMRDLLLNGHGNCAVGEPLPVGFPVKRLAAAMLRRPTKKPDFSYVDIPWPPPKPARGSWMIVESSQRPIGSSDGPRTLVGLATETLRRGEAIYGRLPHLRFGDFVTVERAEIEALRGIRHLMRTYHSKPKDLPLSVGVFGPPGAGKSFAVKELAFDLFGQESWLEFNLSQFKDERDLIGAFHRVRDLVLTGAIPVVFWDEFDSVNYQWLRSLLAPMQDGKFQEGQVTHPIGRAVFIFAGGTASNFEAFGPGKGEQDQRHWELSKGPDFKSRLDAYYDVLGPNRRRREGSKQPDPADIGFALRRALLIRGQLKYKDKAPLRIDADLARALLLAPDYTNGSRSLQKLVLPLKGEAGAPLRRSDLPPSNQIRMHVADPDAFSALLDSDTSFTGSAAIDRLAKAIHHYWREGPGSLKSEEFDREWEKLSDAVREDNREAARRIPVVLALAGLGVTADAGLEAPDPNVLAAHLKHNLEVLAEAEHDGWREFRERNGWRFDKLRDNAKLLHPALVPYVELDDIMKNKDRNSVSHYHEMVQLAGFRIVWLSDGTSPPHVAATAPDATATGADEQSL